MTEEPTAPKPRRGYPLKDKNMKKWLTWIVNPGVVYFIYLGLLLPFLSGENQPVLFVIGIPFAIATAYLWQRARLAEIFLRATGRQNETVEAQRFLLKDSKGNTRGVFGINDYGASLDLYDAGRAVRASMGLLADMPGLTLSDKEGRSVVQVAALEDGAHIALYDANRELRAILGVQAEGPRLELCDQECNSRGKLTVLDDGAHFDLLDSDGKAVFTAP